VSRHWLDDDILYGPLSRQKVDKGIASNQSFYTAKKTLKKEQPIEWEKAFANHISDIYLIYKIYK
jgi:hypothetical protein